MSQSTPHRVQLRRAKGWKMPANTVKVDRTTKWGNPFVVTRELSREESIALFGKLMRDQPAKGQSISVDDQRAKREFILAHIEELRGKNLACWCSLDGPCHADFLLDLANGKSRPRA